MKAEIKVGTFVIIVIGSMKGNVAVVNAKTMDGKGYILKGWFRGEYHMWRYEACEVIPFDIHAPV